MRQFKFVVVSALILFFTGIFISAGAEADAGTASSSPTTVVYQGSDDSGDVSFTVGIEPTSTSSITPAAGFSCSAKATVVIDATYTDSVLDYTNTIYETHLTCTAAVLKETSAVVSLDYDGRGTGNAGDNECSGHCKGVNASNAWDCYDGVVCSGTYQSFGSIGGTLASGYYFTSHSSGCTGGRYTLSCQVHSHKVTVDPVL